MKHLQIPRHLDFRTRPLAPDRVHPEMAPWGIVSADFSPEGFDHLRARWLHVPEGVLVVVLCRHCSARREILADLRQTPPEEQEAVLRGIGQTPSLAAWGEHHVQCVSEAAPVEIAPEVRRRRTELLARARRHLRRGRPVTPVLHLLLSNRKWMAVLPHLPATDGERRIAVQTLHLFLRDMLRDNGVEVLAAVLIAEMWVWKEPAEEVLGAVVTTRTGGEVAYYPIRRASGIPEVGPGTLGPACSSALTEHYRLLEGLLVEQELAGEPVAGPARVNTTVSA